MANSETTARASPGKSVRAFTRPVFAIAIFTNTRHYTHTIKRGMYVTVTKEGGMRKLWVFANDGPWRITGPGIRFLQFQRGWHAWEQPFVTEHTWEILLEHGWAIKNDETHHKS